MLGLALAAAPAAGQSARTGTETAPAEPAPENGAEARVAATEPAAEAPAAATEGADRTSSYRVKPGDQLEISIWKEPDMRRETLVLPDGTVSYPLAGHPKVTGLTPQEIEQLLDRLLASYFNDPFISVVVKRASGNQIYVMGQVRNPGAFTITQPVDVMQALSLAGGLSEFADKGDIIVLRRLDSGAQESIRFAYSSVQRGKKLSSNIILKSGDTVVVPEKGLF
jgi:polysaccharide export outer membrane protein